MLPTAGAQRPAPGPGARRPAASRQSFAGAEDLTVRSATFDKDYAKDTIEHNLEFCKRHRWETGVMRLSRQLIAERGF